MDVNAITPGAVLGAGVAPFTAQGIDYELTISRHSNPVMVVKGTGRTTLIKFSMINGIRAYNRLTMRGKQPVVEFDVTNHPKINKLFIRCALLEEAEDLVDLLHTHILERTSGT